MPADGPPNTKLAIIFLLVCAVVAGGFYFLLFRQHNAASLVDLAPYGPGTADGLQYRVDKCWATKKKVAITGWVVRPGKQTGRRRVRIVMLDRADGRAHALSTSLVQRNDVDALLSGQGSKHVDYRLPGFAASLNLTFAAKTVHDGQLYLLYDDDEGRGLVPLPCDVRWPK